MVLKTLFLMLLFAPQATSTPQLPRDRVLWVCSAADDIRLRQQYDLLRPHQAELKERDFVLAPLVFQPGSHQADQTLRTLGVKDGEFTIVLIGKDGGEKLRQHTPISYEQLAAVIDAMPMRQDEMRNGK